MKLIILTSALLLVSTLAIADETTSTEQKETTTTTNTSSTNTASPAPAPTQQPKKENAQPRIIDFCREHTC